VLGVILGGDSQLTDVVFPNVKIIIYFITLLFQEPFALSVSLAITQYIMVAVLRNVVKGQGFNVCSSIHGAIAFNALQDGSQMITDVVYLNALKVM
jgi:hypothetical protein